MADNNLTYTLDLAGNLWEKLRKIAIANDQQSETWSKVKNQVDAANASMNQMGKSIGSMNQRIAALRAQREWIPAGNREAIRATNREIRSLENEIRNLESLNGGKLSKWWGQLKNSMPFQMITNPIVLATAGIAKFNSYVKESAGIYKTQMEAETKLGAVMKNTMGAGSGEVKSIMELAGAQEKLGVIGGDVQLAGAQELATYLEYPDSLKKIIPAMNDMLAQQYGLTASQEQAAQIATMLGKVMQGQTGALSRYGYGFTEAQEKILKTGTEAQRASVLFDVVTESVGGVNKALAQTPAGKLKQQANNMGDLQARVGSLAVAVQSAFSPAIARVGDLMDKIISKFEAHKDEIIGIVQNLVNVVTGAIDTLWSAVKVVWDVFSAFINGVREGNPVCVMFASVISGIAGAFLLYQTYLKLASAWTSIMTAAQWLLNIAMDANPVGIIILAIGALVGIVATCIKYYEKWGAAVLALTGLFGVVINAIMSLKRNWDSVVSAFRDGGILEGIKRIGVVLLDAILYPVQQLLQLVARIPGLGHLAGAGAEKIASIRKKLGLKDPESKQAADAIGANESIQSAVNGPIKTATGGGLGTGSKSNSATATGGTRSTTVNISVGKFFESMIFNGGVRENKEDIQRNMAEVMARILGVAETATS